MERFFVIMSCVAVLLLAQSNLFGEDGDLGKDDLFSLNDLEFSLSATNIYNINARGGTSTHKRRGRWSGSYDIEVTKDLSGLFGSESSELYMHAEGGWSDVGIDETSVGSFFGVNDDFIGRRSLDLVEVWYQQNFADDKFRIRLGKLDITGGFEHRGCPVSFDCNLYANDETTQFLNGSLVNNPTIPFPDYGLGAIAFWNPGDFWYLSAGIVDARADGRETGFNTTFHGEDHFFYIAETGVNSRLESSNGYLPGASRFGVWYDPRPKEAFDGSGQQRDDAGFYASCDQMLFKENDDAEDSQGLGVFFRYGYADSEINEMTNFYSGGLHYQGLFEGRDDDVLGLGYSYGIFSDQADFSEDYESVVEVYYNAQVTNTFNLSPSVQYVANPGGVSGTSDAVVLALRAQLSF